MGRAATLALALLLGSAPAIAQDAPVDTLADDPAAVFEALLEDESAGDPTELLERLDALRREPLDLNAASAADLAAIPALGADLAAAVVLDRAARGPFGSLPELRRVAGVTADVFLAARPYLAIGPRLDTARRAARFAPVPAWGTVLRGLRPTATQRVQRRLDLAQGYLGPDSVRAYPGSPARVYTRLQAAYRRLVSLNLTLEKDPGERFAWDPARATYGYDHGTAHAAVMGVGRIDALIVGDYAAEFGQGLALWRASGFGKGPDAVGGPVRSGRGLRPYGSVDENAFFRGAALSLAVAPGLYASAFVSRRTLDASLRAADSLGLADPDLPPGAASGVVTSLGADGLHRTTSEVERKDALGETLVGGGLEMRRATGRVVARAGVVGTRSRFDAPLGGGTRPDQLFAYRGDAPGVVSAYGDLRVRGGHAFGEAARGPGGALGAIAGVGADLGGGLDALLLARRYAPGFTSLHGYPFGERNGAGQNETGVYLGARLRPSAAWTVNAYLDQYRFPFLRVGVPRPSVGHEALVAVEHRPRRYLRLAAQARTETREAGLDVPNEVPGSVVGGLGQETRQSARLQGDWDANRRLRLRARVEGTRHVPPEPGAPAATGSLVYHDVRLQAARWLRLDGRLTLFRADAYGARLYAFENDLAGVFSIPALSGRGARAYVLLAATPSARVTVQAKLAATWFRDVRSVSSGNNRIEGDRVRDFGVLVRVRM